MTNDGQRASVRSCQHWRREGGRHVGLCYAAAGGAIASLFGIAAPWLIGGICLTTFVALMRPFAGPPRLLIGASSVALGMSIGSRVGVSDLRLIATWPLSLAGMTVTVAAMFAGSYCALRRIFHWDLPTAFWASSPGALGIVLAMSSQAGADVTKVTIVQLLRVLAVMIALPSIVGPTKAATILPSSRLLGIGLLVFLFSLAGGLALRRLRWIKEPTAMLFSGIIVSCIVHTHFSLDGNWGDALIAPACIVISSNVGSRFSGMGWRDLVQLILPSTLSLFVATAIATAGSLALTLVSGLHWSQVLMAFAPGGLDALIAAAILLGMDSLYVATHQVLRLILLSVALPVAADFFERRVRAEKSARATSGVSLT